MKAFLPFYKFEKGLQTRKGENFRDPDEFTVFQNVRVNGSSVRRPGQARIAILPDMAKASNLDGSTNYIVAPYDARVWRLQVKASLRVVFKQDATPSADQDIIGWYNQLGPISMKINGSGYLVCGITDAFGVTTTLTSATTITPGTKYSVLITRDRGSVKVWLNDAVTATATIDAAAPTIPATRSLWIGARGSTGFGGAINVTNYFDGDIDHVLLLTSTLQDNSEGFLRPADPMADDVTAYYPIEVDSNKLISDLSRFGNTATASHVFSPIASLCVADAPVTGMVQFDNGSGKTLLSMAGGAFNNVEVL